MTVYTYHAFCVQHYIQSCKNDQELEDLLSNNIPPKKDINFDLIILDEAQDITITLYELVCKINKDNIKCAKICILGDENQSIYGYNGADRRYITLARLIYKFNSLKWVELKLSESYRITRQMSDFVNKCCLGYDRIIAKKEGKKPLYIHKDIFAITDPKYNNEHSLINVIQKLMDENNYTNEDIFILAPSIKSTNNWNPIKLLANSFTNKQIPIYIPTSDDQKIDKTQIANKVLFSSFHQAKGLERKLVVVFEFNQEYFTYYARDSDPEHFSNPLYVATTRASENLILLHDYKKPFFNFIDRNILENYVEFDSYTKNDKKNTNNTNNTNDSKNSTIPVTTFIKNITYSFFKTILQFVDVVEINPKCDVEDVIKLCSKTQQKITCEDVAEINGDVIHINFEYKTRKIMSIANEELYNFLNIHRFKRKKTSYTFGACPLDSYNIRKQVENNKCWGNLLCYIVNHHNAKKNNLEFKIHQTNILFKTI